MAFTPGLTCLQPESLARRYWAAPPPPYWGWGYGDGGGARIGPNERF
jgi:hypothetical protein